MLAVLAQIDGYDPVAGATVSINAASVDSAAVCHLNGLTWWPALSKLPVLRYDLFDGSFGSAIAAPSSSLTLRVEAFPNFTRYALADARVRIWTGNVGDTWGSYVLRFDGRTSAQPQTKDGVASVDFAADDKWLDVSLLTTYAGTTGAEGTADLKGQVKPLAIGAPRYVSGKLVDNVNSVFQISGYGAMQSIDVAMEKLARFGASLSDYASYAALVAAAIPAGRWGSAKAVGMARLGAPPVGQISFLVSGDSAGTDGWARTPGKVIRRLGILSGGAGKIDDASLNALDTARPYNISLYLDAQVTARDKVQSIAASVNAVAGVSWLGKLFVAPVAIGAPSIALVADGSALPPVASVEQIDIAAPFSKLAITAERAWTVHALADVAFTATLVDMGDYAGGTTYREGNIVQDQGSTWVYVNPTPSAGNAPPTLPTTGDAYWNVLAKAGPQGASGASVFHLIASGAQVTVTPSSIEKTGGTDNFWGDAAAYTAEGYSGDVQVTARVPSSATTAMIALNSDPATDSNFTSLDFAAMCWGTADHSFRVYESGSLIATVGTVNANDTLYARRRGSNVEYGVVGESSPRHISVGVTSPATVLYLDSAFFNISAKFDRVTFQPLGQDGAAGTPGSAGAPGAPGADGVTHYTWIAYADDISGAANFTTGAPGSRGFQGIAENQTTATEGTNPAAYTWGPYRGPATFGLVAAANCVVGPDYILKTSGNGGAWDASAYSSESFTGGASVSFTVDAVNHDYMVGLNTDPTTDSSYTSIDYAVFLSNNNLGVYENGTGVGNFGTVVIGDRLQVWYDNKNIYYLKNGAVFYSHATTAGLRLFLDTSLVEIGARIGGLAFSGAGAHGNDGAPGAPGAPGANGQTSYLHTAFANSPTGNIDFTTGTPGGRAYIGQYTDFVATDSGSYTDYAWTAYKGPPNFGLAVRGSNVIAGNMVIKNGGAYAWDSDAYSTEGWRSGCQMTFQAGQTNMGIMAGINTDPTTDASYTSIDHAFYCRSDGIVDIWENGSGVIGLGTYTTSTVFQIKYDNINVYYLKDGAVVRTVAKSSDLLFFFDSSIYNLDARIANITWSSSGATGSDGTPGSPGISPYQFDLNKQQVDISLTSAGVIKAGQLPFYVTPKVVQGTTDVTGSCTFDFSYSDSSKFAASYSGGLISVTQADQAGWVDVTPKIGGTAITAAKRISITRTADQAPPATNASANRSDVIVIDNSHTTYTTDVTGTLALQANGSGNINYIYDYLYDCQFSGQHNSDKIIIIAAKLQYRQTGGSTWVDATSEEVGSRALAPGDATGSDYEQGEIYLSGTISGLTAATSYDVRMIFRVYSATGQSAGGSCREYITQ